MGKKATKAANNIYCIARYEAAEENLDFESRESAAEAIGIDRTRLARIELGQITPYPDEICLLAKAYNAPELLNAYCATECPIGKKTVKQVEIPDFDRLALKVLGSLRDIDDIRSTLIAISEDGKINPDEVNDFNSILESLEKIAENATALKLWAMKQGTVPQE